jgi:hypothetical protein
VHILHKLKNRNIIFRVTDEEFDRLKTASNLHGSRCLSEFARTIMLGTSAGVEDKIQALDGRLSTVESDLSRVVNMLSSSRENCCKNET